MDEKKIKALRDFIISAETSLKTAKNILKEIMEEKWMDSSKLDIDTAWLSSYSSGESKIIEWVFTWEEMLWVDSNKYPVPSNYASKSKLVQWDKLKLTISADWRMTYKQIMPIERETKMWLISKQWAKFQVVAEWKTYSLLTASVTHFKWEIWDNVTIVLPKWKDATFAAIENITKPLK